MYELKTKENIETSAPKGKLLESKTLSLFHSTSLEDGEWPPQICGAPTPHTRGTHYSGECFGVVA